MARAISAAERREYVRAVIRITKHQGRLTTSGAMKKLGLSRDTVLKYFREAEATGEVVRHGRSGLFRDQRAVIDFDMKRFGLVPKAAVGMNHNLLGGSAFQRFLDVQEAMHG
ncbi:hypothetical protein DOD04_02085 [Klebsiella michiganensis]|uniref:DUF977 family protein n=1 Tax=Klebsiella oxytoca TaxID=571 RepID=UPI001008C550|nr:DUF977 family protein [Klebsiella oxytoca]MCW9638402.1 DUF977 family protein [Klebsiella oxytoca]RXI20553.1 hypothetical protein DOD04_02085 [Klebsiella michiganensis]HEI9718706.1 DUF977 family protein [Klebsiella oxytoca]HEI9790874.1 DUF977 family protein [Klebsiella oxytoca]